jgi:hypothetical protein
MDSIEEHFPYPVTASPETLMEQAPEVTARFLKKAIKAIDQECGSGYAVVNPTLIGTFIQASVMEFNAKRQIQNLQIIASSLLDFQDAFFDLADEANKRAEESTR